MITLLACWPALTTRLAAVPQLPRLARLASELAGLGCALVFAYQVWAPLVWAAGAVLLVLLGQARK